jgi:hypothetical protein
MDTEQLTEEQLYYKEKYFKYKLKYVTLKKQLDGGGFFTSKKSEPVKTAATVPAPAPAPAPTVTEKKVSSSSPDEILTFLRRLLESQYTEKYISRLPNQRWDTLNTYNYRINKLITAEMEQGKYNLSIFEDIENMLSPVLKTANIKGWLLDIDGLKKYLRRNLKKNFFT